MPSKPSTSKEIEVYEEEEENDQDDDDDMNGIIDGIDTTAHLPPPDDDDNGGEDDDLMRAMNRFMRNEMGYDEFMRVTGGKTIEEELREGKGAAADGKTPRFDEEEEEEEEEEEDSYDEDDDNTEDETMKQYERLHQMMNQELNPTYVETRDDSLEKLPAAAQFFMNQMLSGEFDHPPPVDPPQNLDEALTLKYRLEMEKSCGSIGEPPLKTVKSESSEESTSSAPRRDTDRGKSKRMDGLLGQANVLSARGKDEEAIELLYEVIRQDSKNAMAYHQIASVYENKGNVQMALQFGLLAAYLDAKTPSEDWITLGDEARKIGRNEESAICYDKAIRMNNDNWTYYEKRIEMLDILGLRPLAMKTRLLAAQNINHKIADVDIGWFQNIIKTVAQYYITINDEEKAISALEAFVLRSREFGEEADAQHETLVGMWLAKNKFVAAGQSIVGLCRGIRILNLETGLPAVKVTYTNGTYFVYPFPPVERVTFEINPAEFPVSMHCHLMICLFNLEKFDMVKDLEEKLLSRDLWNGIEESYFLDVARTYKNKGKIKLAMRYLEGLANNSTYRVEEAPDYHYLKGTLEMALKNDLGAIEAFEMVLQLKPDHIDTRIHLSTLQQKLGMFDKALETLRDHDLELGTELPDERLLARQADILFEAGDIEQFIRTTRILLAPHFYDIHLSPDLIKRRRPAKSSVSPALSATLKVAALNLVKHTNWERLVKRLGAAAQSITRPPSLMTSSDLHDYCLKLIECLTSVEKHTDSLIVCCYAFIHPKLIKADKTITFQNLLYFCATKARNWSLAFEYVRFFYTYVCYTKEFASEDSAYRDMLHKRIFNAMNYIFVNSQNVSYHRFIMRALIKQKENHALQAISGNNSLITGTYRHALGEYLRVWTNNKKNPLICLLLGLTFTHMSCKKDLSSRHLISIRGIAFIKKYSKVRTCTQEVYYNCGRMFQQMSMLPLAKHFYDKVLEENPPMVYEHDEEGNETAVPAVRYDLRKLAAHNLALMYRASGNNYAAREVYEKYLTV